VGPPNGAFRSHIFQRIFTDFEEFLMRISHFLRSKTIVLGLGLLGAFALPGCDGGREGEAPAFDPANRPGPSQAEARKKEYGPSGNPDTTKKVVTKKAP